MEYMKEATNNYAVAVKQMKEKGVVELACVYCVEIHPVVRRYQMKTITNNTLICNSCGIDAIVPIVPKSVLQTQCSNFDEQVQKLQEWHKEAFESFDDEEDVYEDYEYEESNALSDDIMFSTHYGGEEMKDALQQEI